MVVAQHVRGKEQSTEEKKRKRRDTRHGKWSCGSVPEGSRVLAERPTETCSKWPGKKGPEKKGPGESKANFANKVKPFGGEHLTRCHSHRGHEISAPRYVSTSGMHADGFGSPHHNLTQRFVNCIRGECIAEGAEETPLEEVPSQFQSSKLRQEESPSSANGGPCPVCVGG
ncbi:hypothetical protein RUM44_004882 [Polyplax serrata]|uniref:Uncharacterized protein n=1 Tax=Polyplax serrata TaxID=468196 RepID=A0ABR1B423_POLSC